MFGLFKKSSKSTVKVTDRVWMSTNAKAIACAALQENDPGCLFVAWFENTFQSAKSWIDPERNGAICLCHATDLPKINVSQRSLVFLEHYPLTGMEQQLFSMLGRSEVIVFSSLDEPLFQLFGGERLVTIMERMGMQETEAIEHPMVTKSIERAQQKIAKHVQTEKVANSQQEWFELNYKK